MSLFNIIFVIKYGREGLKLWKSISCNSSQHVQYIDSIKLVINSNYYSTNWSFLLLIFLKGFRMVDPF